jgi:hypothetical protein
MNRRNLPSVVKATSGVIAGQGVKGLTSGRMMHKSHTARRLDSARPDTPSRSPADTRAALHYNYRKLQLPNPNPLSAGGSGLN